MFWALSGCYTLPSDVILRILINFIFDFQAIKLFAQSQLHHLSTSLSLKLVYVLSASFLAYGSCIKVFRSSRGFQ